MKLARCLAPLAAILAFAACTAPTDAPGPKEVYYLTPAAPSQDHALQGETSAGFEEGQSAPFFRNGSVLTPVSDEDMEELKMQPDVTCYAEENGIRVVICCPWQKGCVTTIK